VKVKAIRIEKTETASVVFVTDLRKHALKQDSVTVATEHVYARLGFCKLV